MTSCPNCSAMTENQPARVRKVKGHPRSDSHLSSQRSGTCPPKGHLSSQRSGTCPPKGHQSSQRSGTCRSKMGTGMNKHGPQNIHCHIRGRPYVTANETVPVRSCKHGRDVPERHPASPRLTHGNIECDACALRDETGSADFSIGRG